MPFSLVASVDTASIVTEVEKSKDEKIDMPEPDIGVQEKAEKDKLLDALMGKPTQKEENSTENPSVAKTEKSPPSEPLSEKPSKSAEGATMTDRKPSVKEELRKIKESRKEQEAEQMRRLEMERQRRQRLEIKIPDEITVGELASRLKVQAAEIIKRLMSVGVMASISDVIDYDTAALVAMEIGAKVEKEVFVTIEERLFVL